MSDPPILEADGTFPLTWRRIGANRFCNNAEVNLPIADADGSWRAASAKWAFYGRKSGNRPLIRRFFGNIGTVQIVAMGYRAAETVH